MTRQVPRGAGIGGVLLSPSLMCADFCRLEEDVKKMEALPVELLHLDLMDAHFVPNMPMGLAILSALRDRTVLPFDVHLMVEDNDWFIEQIADIGAEQIAIHAESAVHLDRSLSLIRSKGILAGVALNPATPLSALDYILGRLDFILLMTVNPGYAGQKLVEGTIQKIADCRRYLHGKGVDIPIEVDGNVSFENISRMVAAGAEILVAGTSSLYHSGASLDKNMKRVREEIRKGLDQRPALEGAV